MEGRRIIWRIAFLPGSFFKKMLFYPQKIIISPSNPIQCLSKGENKIKLVRSLVQL